LIGGIMRLYRRSPLHPRLGSLLAKALHQVTSRMRSPRLKVVRGFTWELDLGEVIDASLYFSGSFEPLAERILERHLAAGDVVIDVGANVGYHTLPMARRVGEGGLVLAVEPNPSTRARLERNLSLNPISNVRVLPVAVGDRDLDSRRLRIQSSYPLSGESAREEIDVPIRTLDRIVADHQLARVDLIKIDVDGQEGGVFRGAAATLERFRPVLFFELTPGVVRASSESPESLLGGLVGRRYRLADERGRPASDWRRLLAELGDTGAVNLLAVPEERAARDGASGTGGRSAV
jgi:FkbM family methyltransferase